MQFELVKSITYEASSDLSVIMNKLNSLPNLIACDFETASRWTDEEKETMKEFLKEHEEDSDVSFEERRLINQYIQSTGLSHPSLTYITHFSVAWSEEEAFVAILDTEEKRKVVTTWLSECDNKQLWHNLSFDGKLIMYHTGKLPKNYEDTEILSRCLLNHTQTDEAKSGLKHLMGYRYGDWAVSKDNFNLNNLYDEELIKYAGIDACATFALYNEIMEFVSNESDK